MGPVAHAGPSAPPLDLEILVPLAVATLAVLSGHRRSRLMLAAGALAIAVVVLPPVRGITERSVTGHMVQHLVLIAVAAPLVGTALGRLPTSLRRVAAVRTILRHTVTPSPAPLVAGVVHAATMAVWHLPGAYDAAVHAWWIHGFEHVSMLGSGVWWWATLAHHAPRRAAASTILAVFAVATSGAAVGVLMMFAPTPLYEQGGVGDQQVAGALMAGGTGALLGVTALVLVVRLIDRTSAPHPLRVPVPSRATWVAVGLIAVSAAGGFAMSSEDAEAASAPRREAPRGGAAAQAEDPAPDGEHLYLRDCAWCHGDEGRGGRQGPSLEEVGSSGVVYMLSTGRMPIDDPSDAVARGEPRYDDDEIAAIVDHVTALVGDAAPLPESAIDPPSPPDVARGGETYRALCAACHGGTGIGGALAFAGYAPTVQHASTTEAVAAMVSGPGTMPTFRGTLDDADLAEVAAYVRYLQEPVTTGVAIPGGRVGEGLIAWVVGVGALVVLARIYGRTA